MRHRDKSNSSCGGRGRPVTQWASSCTFRTELPLSLQAVPCRGRTFLGSLHHSTRGRPASVQPPCRQHHGCRQLSSCPQAPQPSLTSPGAEPVGVQTGARSVPPGNESPQSSESVSLPPPSPQMHLRNSSGSGKGWEGVHRTPGLSECLQSPFSCQSQLLLPCRHVGRGEFLENKKMIQRQELVAPKEMIFQQHSLYQLSAAA